MKAKKQKFEVLWVHMYRSGEVRSEKAHNARDAARIAAKHTRKGWSVKVKSAAKSHGLNTRSSTFMTCEPSARKAYWSDPDVKAHAICTMTSAFKKRVRGR